MAIRLSSGGRRSEHRGELRPTAARTLESVFDILAGEVNGCHVLDLFAGVGSYGILALKHQAASAVFVDKSNESSKRLLQAIAKYHLEDRTQVFKEDVFHFLHKTERGWQPFDLIFADPPYEIITPAAVIEEILDAGLLAHGGILVFEHTRHQAPPVFPALTLRRSRVFGETTVSIWDHA
jgi:16S rRNA (guanine966-N2)-methyltransferase